MNDPMNLLLHWSPDDNEWSAVLVRDGQPWYLDGALVGMGTTQAQAVQELVDLARHLARHGTNFLTPEPLPLADRQWLFGLLDHGVSDDETYAALRTASETAQ